MQTALTRDRDEGFVWGIFVRLVGLCFLVTFWSETRQILGLLGSRGILSLREFVEAASQLAAPYRYLRLPTLFWVNHSDTFIAAVPWIGAVAALSVIIGVASRACLLICYVLHLSTVIAGGDFFFYPWDFLLLEMTILTLFVPPLRRLPSVAATRAPPRLVALAILLLLFRLQFGMGIYKFYDASDSGWRDLVYVHLFQQSQPMPTGPAWYAFNYVPAWISAGMDLLTLLSEVPLPFLLLIRGKARLFAALTMAALHVGIAICGNFGTFQLLTLTLCIACVSDAQAYAAINWLRRRFKQPEIAREAAALATPPRGLARFDSILGSGVAIAAVLCGIVFTARMLQPGGMTPLSNTRWLFGPDSEHSVTYPGSRFLRLISPFFLSYPYGIFRESGRVGPRRGIVFQGSQDGVHWKTYENKFNPVEPIHQRPQFFAPGQPRLDHLFIYEAGRFHFAYINGINPYYGARRVLPFISKRLFEQSPEVLSLFRINPFPDRPPAQLRVRVASYRFTTPAERAETGAWWYRTDESVIGPITAAVADQMVAEERRVAAGALLHAITVDERARPTTREVLAAAGNVEPWMPPWKFWLVAAPGWLPLCIQMFAALIRNRFHWKLRRVE
jgi:hypothetical protein